AYGRGADRDARLRPDHAALWPCAADGVEIRRRQLRQGAARRAADLRRVPDHHHLHDLFPERRAVAPQARDPGIGRLLQVARRHGLHMSELICTVLPANAALLRGEGARERLRGTRAVLILPLPVLTGRGWGEGLSPRARRAESPLTPTLSPQAGRG